MANDPARPGQERISVSHSLLRAELAEMELRLRVFFDEQLKHKADAATVEKMKAELNAIDRGDFTPVHRRALVELIEEVGATSIERRWTSRERVFGVLALLITVLSFAFTVYVATAAAGAAHPKVPTTPTTTTGDVQ